ncbi:MAG: MFS transporter [Candidatus Bathyarchaeia archaeon]
MSESKSGRQTDPPIHLPFFYGWVIIILSSLTLFFSGPGQTYSVSTFIDSYIEGFSWSRSLVSSLYSAGTLSAGLLMGFMGNFFDRKGHRLMTTVIAIGLGLACLWMSFVKNPIMLVVGFFLIRLLGQGSMGLASMTLPLQWFIKRRGQALSFVSLGGTIASAVLPPLNTYLIQNFGWKNGWRFWAILLWVLMAPIAYLLIRDRPEDLGLLPDDENRLQGMRDGSDPIIEESWTLKEALSTRSFWLLLFCIAVPSAIITGLIFHQVSVMSQLGLSAEKAAMVLSSMAMIRIPMIFIAGQLADRIQPRILMSFNQGLLLLGIITLYLSSSMILALTYGLLIGLMMGFQSIVGSVIWPDYYGREHLSSIRGVTMMAGVIGSSLGPLPFGFAYDLFGGYREILLISMIFSAMGIVAALIAKNPAKYDR